MELVHMSCGFRVIVAHWQLQPQKESAWNEAENQAESHELVSVYLGKAGKQRRRMRKSVAFTARSTLS